MADNKAKSFRTCGKNGVYVLKYSKEIENLPDFSEFSSKYDECLAELQPTYISKIREGMSKKETLIKLGEAVWDKLYETYGVRPIFERR